MKDSIRKVLLPLIPLVFGIAVLEGITQRGWIEAFILPAPSQILHAFIENQSEFLLAFKQTGVASIIGLLMSVVAGLLVAMVLSISDLARSLFYPYAVFFQTVPIIAIAPLLVIWFGYGMPTVIASSFIVSSVIGNIKLVFTNSFFTS